MLTVRELRMEDLHAAAELHALSGRSGYRGMLSDEYLDGPRLAQSLDSWTRRLGQSPERALSLGAFECDGLIGLICLEFGYDEDFGTLLDTLHVHPDYRGGRVGQALIREAAKRMLVLHDDGPIHLSVFEANARARRLYDQIGRRVVRKQLGCGPDGTALQECIYYWASASTLAEHSAA